MKVTKCNTMQMHFEM